MRVGAARDDVEAALDERRGKRLRIVGDGARIDLELGLQRLAQHHGFRRDDMHQRPALQPREHRAVDLLADILVVAEDHAAARAAQRLMRCGGDDMRMRQRARMDAAGDEPGEMRHIDHEIGADGLRDLAEAAKSIMRG